jgi:hypothetical protein
MSNNRRNLESQAKHVLSLLSNYTKKQANYINSKGNKPNSTLFMREIDTYIKQLVETPINRRPGQMRSKITSGLRSTAAALNPRRLWRKPPAPVTAPQPLPKPKPVTAPHPNTKPRPNQGRGPLMSGNTSGRGRSIPSQARNSNVNKQFLSFYKSRFGQNKNFPNNYNNRKKQVLNRLNKYPVWHLMRHGPTRNAIQVGRLITNDYNINKQFLNIHRLRKGNSAQLPNNYMNKKRKVLEKLGPDNKNIKKIVSRINNMY